VDDHEFDTNYRTTSESTPGMKNADPVDVLVRSDCVPGVLRDDSAPPRFAAKGPTCGCTGTSFAGSPILSSSTPAIPDGPPNGDGISR